MSLPCEVDECDNPRWRDGICRGHYRRRTLHQPMTELRHHGRTKADAFWDAVFDLLDLAPTNDEGWRRARYRVEITGRRRWASGRKTK